MKIWYKGKMFPLIVICVQVINDLRSAQEVECLVNVSDPRDYWMQEIGDLVTRSKGAKVRLTRQR